jgi:putative transposase
MERFFRSLKTEWVPEIGYRSFPDAKHDITAFMTGYYNAFRPHTHNNGMTPIAAERQYWNACKTLAKKT